MSHFFQYSEYYVQLLKQLGILVGLTVVATILGIMFVITKNVFYAYSDSKRKGKNGNWIGCFKEVVKDFNKTVRELDWVKKIPIMINKTSTPNDNRPDDSVSRIVFNEREDFPNCKPSNLINPLHKTNSNTADGGSQPNGNDTD